MKLIFYRHIIIWKSNNYVFNNIIKWLFIKMILCLGFLPTILVKMNTCLVIDNNIVILVLI